MSYFPEPYCWKHLSLIDGGVLFKYLYKFLQLYHHGLHTLVCAAPQACEVAPRAVERSAYIKCLSAAPTCQSCTSTTRKSGAITLLAAEQNISMAPLTHTSSLGCGSRWMGTSSNWTADTLITYQNGARRRWGISGGEGLKMFKHNQQSGPQALLGFN